MLLTYQKIAQNWIKTKMTQMTAFLVQNPKIKIRANVERIVIEAILLSFSNIFLICPLKPARKKVPPIARTNPKRYGTINRPMLNSGSSAFFKPMHPMKTRRSPTEQAETSKRLTIMLMR